MVVKIKPTALGQVNITVGAVVNHQYPEACGTRDTSINRRDTLIKPITVEVEGFPRETTRTNLVHCFVLSASLNPIQRHGVTMWGRTLWLTVISCVVYQQLGCHAQSRAGMEEYQSDGGGDLHPPPPPYLSDDIAFNRSVVNQTLHSTPAISARVMYQASYPIPDINILYKFKRNSRAPDELSYITGDPQLTLQTEVLPRHSRSLRLGEPVINLWTSASHVHFSVQAPPGASNNLQYRYRHKITRKACTSPTYSPRFADWSQWYDTRPTVVTPIEELAYSTVTFSVIATNSAWVGPEAVKSVDVGTAVPLLAIESLNCEEHQPTSCSVRLQTSCYKENGPGITVSYDLVNDGTKEVISKRTSAPRSLVLPNNELPPYTWITIRAYPANIAGRNTNSSLMKEDHFRTAPGKPGQVSNVNIQEASNSITVSWEKPLDNPIRGELEGYKVKWKSINSRSWEEERIHNSNTLSYTITGLTNHEVYEIRVSAKNKDVDEYGDDVTTSATPQEGKPSPVKDVMVVNVTQTTATVVWNEPDDSQGTIENYIVSLVKEPQGNISRNITERIYEFTNLQEGGKYIAGVKICNKKFCSYPVNKEFYTRPALPQVDGEPGLMYSDSTSVTVRLPVLHNLPGYQWIVLMNIRAWEDPDVLIKVFEESLKKAVVKLVNETSVLESSNRIKRSVENPKEMRIVARISQREDNLTKKFTVGDNETYDNYENEPLEEGSTYLLVVATERKSGPHNALVASSPIPITAVPYPTVNYLVVGFICLLLLLVLLMVVLALLYYKKHRAKLRTGGTANDLVTYTDGNENPRVNIEDLNRQEEELYLTPLTPSNPGSYPSVRVAEVEEVPEELSHREKVLGVEEEENEDDGTYYYVCRRIFEDGLESYLSRAMFVLETDQEFKKIPYIMSKSCSDGEEAVNSKKNRYKNNLPYNDTRVKLPLVNNKLGSDYINACYVKSTGNPKAFIATQTPMDNEMDTIGDFWRMIWHTKCSTIVKGVNLTENGEVNDAKYWPNIDEQMVKYDITIQLLSEEVKLGFHVRVFKVTRRDEAREIVQYDYPNWTDYGVAYNPFGLAQMLKLIRSTTPVGPITVHCSNGIGWTGMVILVLYVLEELEAMKYTSPAKALGVIRTGRPRLVEKMEQYRFGHSLLLEILFGVKTSIISSSYVMELSQLRASNLINNQYTKLKTLPKDLSFKFAEKPVFANLNRNPNILPGELVDMVVECEIHVYVMVVVESVRVDVMVVVEGVRVDVMVVEGVRVDVMVVVECVRVDVMVVVVGVRVYVMVVVEGVRVDVMVVVEGVRVDVMVVVEGVRVYVMVVVECEIHVYVMVVVEGVRVDVMVVVEGVRVDVMVVEGVRVDVMVVEGVRVDVMVVVEGVRVYVMVVVEGVRVDVMVVEGVRVDVMVVVEGVRVDVMVVVGVRVDVMVVVEGVRVDVMVVEGVRVDVMVVVEGVRVDVMVVEGVRVDVMVVEGVRVDVMVVVEGVRVDVMVVKGVRVDVMVVVEGVRVDVMVVEGVRVDVMVVVEGVRVDVMVVEGVRVDVMVVEGVRVDVMVVEGVRVDVMVVEGVRVDVMVVEGVRVDVMVVEGVRVDVMVVEGVRVDVMVVVGVRVDVMVVVVGVRVDVMVVVEGVRVDVMVVVEGVRVDVIHVYVMVLEGDRVDVIHVYVMVLEGDRVDVIHVYVMVVEGDRVDVIHVYVMVVESDRVDVIHVDVMVVEVDSRLVFLRGVLGNIASQYINVIKINGLDCRDAYLAGEHPQEHTVEAAWRLVMEHQVSVWVHLHTFPHPNPEYPEIVSGEGTMDIGMMRLIVGPPSSFRNFTEYTVDIIPTTTTSSIATPHHRMVVLQLHGWSHTQSLPEQPDALLAVLEKAESLRIINQQMLFTCKDGVTGCGVAAALLLARERIKLIQEVDVYRSVLSVLFDRPEFITCVEQYNFLYTAMEKFITGNKLYGNFA
ncbi:hypothetical protein Pmani_009819 [Petrolisthes manimaculis]|uniref:Protein-tyrosine-phosphatase n=1 Tax=Petrolisthes manimaculis TaxID=1843537 RepID=A0AAE1Q488_9EUCA|nr:hypothetical protein Pmani_009819 [Petrolisthes manimaculis]